MRSRLVLASFVVVVGIAVYASTVLATPPSGVKPTEFGIGKFRSIDTTGRIGAWRATMNIKGASDLHVLQNRIAPGGSFGWHSHPGPSFVIVKSGTATVYLGADPKCRPHRYRAGSGFVDKGLAVHIVRNEGVRDLVTVVVSFVPAGAERRIDEADSGACPF
ncbi:MAG: cupin domain-containing protein [Actinomycetota bacterium]|nr:cupin domain-containing protein [Actinomycetota bacterium]